MCLNSGSKEGIGNWTTLKIGSYEKITDLCRSYEIELTCYFGD